MSASERSCVAVISGPQNVKIKITFPSLYPHGAAPSFRFLDSNFLTAGTQAKFNDELTEVASFHVENGKPCLFQCLTHLAVLLKGKTQNNSMFVFLMRNFDVKIRKYFVDRAF